MSEVSFARCDEGREVKEEEEEVEDEYKKKS